MNERELLALLGVVFIGASLFGCYVYLRGGREHPPGENFMIVVLPDTQYYSADYPTIFKSQTRWIVRNEDERNIVFVAHEGDIVNRGRDEAQWQRARSAMGVLDGEVPYGFCAGNHDMVTANHEANLMARYLPPAKFEDRWYWGGQYWDDKNNYQLIHPLGVKLLILHIEYRPPKNVLSWADGVLDKYPERYAIIVTHSFLNTSGGRTPAGRSIWNNLVVPHSNVRLVLCGHEHGEARRTDTVSGRTVHQLLANYQFRNNRRSGLLRMYTFVPSENMIQVRTYSPYRDSYETDPSSQFTLTSSVTLTPSPRGPASWTYVSIGIVASAMAGLVVLEHRR